MLRFKSKPSLSQIEEVTGYVHVLYCPESGCYWWSEVGGEYDNYWSYSTEDIIGSVDFYLKCCKTEEYAEIMLDTQWDGFRDKDFVSIVRIDSAELISQGARLEYAKI